LGETNTLVVPNLKVGDQSPPVPMVVALMTVSGLDISLPLLLPVRDAGDYCPTYSKRYRFVCVCVCVVGCYSDRIQQLRQLYKTLQAARKLQTSASATAASWPHT